jgi:thiopeptide-type bacteriocin biosynthesis protein
MTRWVSLYLFHSGGLDSVLVRGIYPLVSHLRSVGACDRWFFVRYWNGGSHIRLRLEVSANAEPIIRTSQDALSRFLRSEPRQDKGVQEYQAVANSMSAMLDAAAHDAVNADIEPVETLQPDGSVQVRRYDYDASRYGGGVAQTLAEGHFWRSSELARSIVAHTLGDHVTRLGIAYELLAVLPCAAGWATDEAIRLFQAVSDMHCYMRRNDRVLREVSPASVTSAVALIGRLNSLDYDDSRSLNAVASDIWRQEITNCNAILNQLQANGDLALSPQQVLLSYVHMFNNRLGIDFGRECNMYGALVRVMATVDEIMGSRWPT